MSLQELKAFVEPLSVEEKRALQALLQDEMASESQVLNAANDWVTEHENSVAAVVKAHPDIEMPADLSQTWKQTRRAQGHQGG